MTNYWANQGQLNFGGSLTGYHNYHHNFPWDYRAAEEVAGFNLTSVFIEICAKLGLAFNLRTASSDVVRAARVKQGDGQLINAKQQEVKSLAIWAQEVVKQRKIGEQTCEFL